MEFSPIPASKYEEVLEHLRQNFPDEPLNAAVGLCKHGQVCELLEHHDLMTLKDNLSVMAVDGKTGEIAGVALNGISRRNDIEEGLRNMESIDNLAYQRIFGLLYNVNKPLDLFSKYNVAKIFELRILSVDTRFRGRGLAKQLFLRSELLAEESGFKIVKVDATSLYTQKIAEDLGFATEKSVLYRDFKDDEGKCIYQPVSPHDYFKVMVKVIKPKSESA